MKTPLRYMYNPAFFERLCPLLQRTIPQFDSRDFIFRIFNNSWPDMELKDRVRHISKVLHHFLPKDFRFAAPTILALLQALKQEDFPRQGFENIFLAEYVEVFGREYPEISADVLDHISKVIGARYAHSQLISEGRL